MGREKPQQLAQIVFVLVPMMALRSKMKWPANDPSVRRYRRHQLELQCLPLALEGSNVAEATFVVPGGFVIGDQHQDSRAQLLECSGLDGDSVQLAKSVFDSAAQATKPPL